MGNLQASSQGDLALGSVTFPGGVPTFQCNRGFAQAITDNGLGDSTLQLDNAQALVTSGCVQVTLQGTVPGAVAVEVVDATHIRVRTFSLTTVPAVAAADIAYWVRVTPIAAN